MLVFAEKYRGLYSLTVDKMIDEMAALEKERIAVNKLIGVKDENLSNLQKYYILSCKIDDLWENIQKEANSCS
jgi:hypothetical protein